MVGQANLRSLPKLAASPAMTKFESVFVARMMQIKLPISIAFAAAMLLAGCAQFERSPAQSAAGDDDAYCRANAAAGPGSSAYAACLKDRDVANTRASGSSRIERAHRNLAEDMLNNPR
jgi:hypothetical protein